MALTLTGVFDDPTKAELASQRLREIGIAEDYVRSHTGGMLDSDASTRGDSEPRGFLARLFGIGDHDEHSGHIAEAARRGSSVVTVHLENEEQAGRVEQILEDAGAIDIEDRVRAWQATGYTGYDAAAAPYTQDEIARERETLQVLQEEIRVGKREVQAGGVRIHRRVIETPVQEQVSLREERAVIERHPVDRIASADDLRAFDAGDRDIEIRESREEAVVEKRARVVEEVSIGKETLEHSETINETLRRTDVDIEEIDSTTNLASTQRTDPSDNRPLSPR